MTYSLPKKFFILIFFFVFFLFPKPVFGQSTSSYYGFDVHSLAKDSSENIASILNFIDENNKLSGTESVVRLWGYQSTFGIDGINNLQKVLDAAPEGMKFIVSLEDFNYGPVEEDPEAWFSSGYKEDYLSYVEEIVNRYKDSQQITVWEIMNEPQCKNISDCSSAFLNFMDEISTLINSIDNDTLISAGAMPWDQASLTETYKEVMGLSNITAADCHFYGSDQKDACLDAMSLANSLGIFFYIGEAGYKASGSGDEGSATSTGCTNVGSLESLQSRADQVQEDLSQFFSSGAGAFIIWQFSPEGSILLICDPYSFFPGDPIFQITQILPYTPYCPEGEICEPAAPQPEIACTNNPDPEEGVFRPDTCDACGQNPEFPTLSCAETFTVSQDTWVDVTGEIMSCQEGSVDGAYSFTRSWGGPVEIDISDTTVPFAGYHDDVEDMETKYLADYFTGSYGRTGPECDVDDPECVTKVFKEMGVMTKLLPKEEQDKYRCRMISKVLSGEEFDYEVTDGETTLHVSDFANTPNNNIRQISQLKSAFCAKPEVPENLTESNYQQYLQDLQLWQDKKTAQYDDSIYDKLWAFVPQVTYKDAPGVLSLVSQGPPGYLTLAGSGDKGQSKKPAIFSLSFPHLGRLYEASKIVQEALIPKYKESQLAPTNSDTSSADTNTVLASNQTNTEILEQNLENNDSYCGLGQVLAESTASQSYLTVSIEIERVDLNSGKVYYGVRIYQNGPEKGHQWLNGRDIGAGEPGEYGYYLSSQDPNWSDVLAAATIDPVTGEFTVPLVHTWNHQMTDEAWIGTREDSRTCSGKIDLKTGEILTTDCLALKAGQVQPEKKCSTNVDAINPGTCKDEDAIKDEENPDDLICANPYPLVADLTVNDYSAVMTASTYEELQKKVAACVSACQKDNNSPNCQPPCNYQQFGPLSRKIGLDLNLPYLEEIGHLTISNFYRYEDDKSQKGEFTPNASTDYQYGIFDIFRPSEMLHYTPWEAKSNLGYEYYAGWSDSQVSGGKSEAQMISQTHKVDKISGELYYPWLGGVQRAKQCLSQGLLLPSQLGTNTYCPDFGVDDRTPTAGNPSLPPTLSPDFILEEKAIENKEKENVVLDTPEAEAIDNEEEARQILENLGYSDYIIDRIIANLPAYQEAEKITGIPWEVLAAIHAVETNFRSDNPKGNDDGPMQVTGSEHASGETNSYTEFVDILLEAVGVIESKIATARNQSLIDEDKSYSDFTNEDWAQIAYYYNGRPAEKTGPDGETYYGTDSDSWQNSGYVSNGWNGQEDMWVSDGQGGWVNMGDRLGFLAQLENLQSL